MAIPLWNTTAEPISFNLTVDARQLVAEGQGKPEVTSLESGKRLRHQDNEDTISIKMQLLPHEVAVVLCKSEPN